MANDKPTDNRKYVNVETIKEVLQLQIDRGQIEYDEANRLFNVIYSIKRDDVAEIDSIEKALLERCTINSYGGLTKADVVRELAKFRRQE